MALTKLEYKIIDVTKCGKEPLFVLISMYWKLSRTKNIKLFFSSLIKLAREDFLECTDRSSRLVHLSLSILNKYVARRTEVGEILSEPPDNTEDGSLRRIILCLVSKTNSASTACVKSAPNGIVRNLSP